MTSTRPRKTISIYDYPEHLNPFHEEDNHNKIRFWTIGRKLTRSNSFNFSGLKDIRKTWTLRSFMRKGKKDQSTNEPKKSIPSANGDTSPIVYRRALEYSSASTSGANIPNRRTITTPERPDRYIHGGSITPLPRSRFQERLRSSSQHDVDSINRAGPSEYTPRCTGIENYEVAYSDINGSRLSMDSTNTFDGRPPVRASRRKKKRAPLPPQSGNEETDINSTKDVIVQRTVQFEGLERDKENNYCLAHNYPEEEIEDPSLKVELKIVEDKETVPQKLQNCTNRVITFSVQENNNNELNGNEPEESNIRKINDFDKSGKVTGTSQTSGTFAKIDIVKYRRNSSFNEDDVRLRRGNLEDFIPILCKRSNSLTNDNLIPDFEIKIDEKDYNDNDSTKPQKVVCKLYNETTRKQNIDKPNAGTEKEFIEIDKATRALEREINKLNSAIENDESLSEPIRWSVSEMKRKFDNRDMNSPNPIPKPRRSRNGTNSPIET